MPNMKEIKNHIASVKDTQKITNAMYLIASTKLRKAKRDLDQTLPYFNALRGEIKRIFRSVGNIDNRYFYPVGSGGGTLPGTYGYLVITADKGLAGAYNQNAIREAQRMLSQHDGENKVFVVGEYGRQHFAAQNIPIEQNFLYTAQNPTLQRARNITAQLLDLYRAGDLVKIFVTYTDMGNSLESSARTVRLLPFHRAQFASATKEEERVKIPFEFSPSVEKVLDSMIPSYVSGFIYSALVDSFCSEQNARMTAMDSANQNAQELLDELSAQYNHTRQSAITQEITEISAGALGQRRHKQRLDGLTGLSEAKGDAAL